MNESGRLEVRCPRCGGSWDVVAIFDRYCYAAFGMCRGCGAMATTDFDHRTPNEATVELACEIASRKAREYDASPDPPVQP